MSDAGLEPPVFHSADYFFSVTFKRPQNDTVKLTPAAVTVLGIMKADGTKSGEQIAKETGLSAPTISQTIKELKSQYIIKRIGSDKSGHWDIL